MTLALDPAGVSLTHFLVLVFPQKRARAEAINLARGAAVFAEGDVQGRPSYFAAFSKTPEQASLALRLQSYLHNRDYIDQYAGGRLLDNRHKNGVIACYRDALRSSNPLAYCTTVEGHADLYGDERALAGSSFAAVMEEIGINPPPIPAKRYLFPCSYMREQRFELFRLKPAPAIDQIRAGAIKIGCDWCPLFDAAGFGELTRPH